MIDLTVPRFLPRWSGRYDHLRPSRQNLFESHLPSLSRTWSQCRASAVRASSRLRGIASICFHFKARDGKCRVPARCRSVLDKLDFLWWWRELDLGLIIAACRISTHTKLKLVSLMWTSRSNRKYWPNLTNSMNFTPRGKIAHLAWWSRRMKPVSDTIT